MTEKNEWGSNLSFILAIIGSAVGLGNIWRYPYVLYANGGGAFYIPYIIAILVLAIPFIILEYGVGYNFKSSFTKAMIKINPQTGVFRMDSACRRFHNDNILFHRNRLGRNLFIFELL